MAGVLAVRRIHADCLVAGAPERATAFAAHARRALGQHLGDALRQSCAPWMDGADEGVWIVRRLDAGVMVDADAPADVLAAAVAAALARALGAALSGNGDGTDAIRFADRAAHLAEFVRDAAAGRAWGRWYHAPFAGLEALSPSAAIRTALGADAPRGRAALARLDDRALAGVAAALDEADEARVLEAFARAAEEESGFPPTVSAAEERSWTGLPDAPLAAAWEGCARAWTAAGSGARALHAFVRAGGAGAVPPPALVAAVLQARRRLEASSGPRLVEVPGGGVAPASGPRDRVGVMAELVRAVLHAAAAPARRRGRTDAEAALPGLERPVPSEGGRGPAGARAPEALEEGAVHVTRWGGLLLLLRDLDALPWHDWTAGWPPLGPAAAGTVLRWLTLAWCAGGPGVARAFEDGVLRGLCGIPGPVTPHGCAGWLRAVGDGRRRALAAALDAHGVRPPRRRERAWLAPPGALGLGARWSAPLARTAGAVLRGFARRLPGFADSTPAHLWRNVLDFEAEVVGEDARVVVHCGRPPLHLLLALTGMTRGLEAGRDAQGRPIVLFPAR